MPCRRPNEPGYDANDSASLYNGMIHPLLPYAVKGAIWYQGESNAGRAYEYRTLMPTMITSWRKAWKQGDFPFLMVQLAPFMKIEAEPKEKRVRKATPQLDVSEQPARSDVATDVPIPTPPFSARPRQSQRNCKRPATRSTSSPRAFGPCRHGSTSSVRGCGRWATRPALPLRIPEHSAEDEPQPIPRRAMAAA